MESTPSEDHNLLNTQYKEEKDNGRSVRPPSFSGPDVSKDGFASKHSQAAKQQIAQDYSSKEHTSSNAPKTNEGWRELIFRIKLTPEEYSAYLHEKAKRL